MIIYFPVLVKDLFNSGKDYRWQRPDECPICKGRRVWGHGFATRYFSGFIQKLWVKRYRCPDCNAVHTIRPATHWKGFQSSRFTILRSLLNKIRYNTWRSSNGRQNQQYWFKGLIYQSSRFINTLHPTADVVRKLISMAIIPAIHSTHSECLRL